MGQDPDVVREFYSALHAHDWVRLAATMADDVVRVGVRDNEEDTCAGKQRYMDYVRSVIGRFERHEMRIVSIFHSADGRRAAAETVETIQPPGSEVVTLHNFKRIEINEDGLISRFDQFWKLPPVLPPSWITVDAIESGVAG